MSEAATALIVVEESDHSHESERTCLFETAPACVTMPRLVTMAWKLQISSDISATYKKKWNMTTEQDQ